MAKLLKFFALFLFPLSGSALAGFVLFQTAGAILVLLASCFFFSAAFFCGPRLLVGQINGRMASSSTHVDDFLTLKVIAKQSGVVAPKVYIYDSTQINLYLVKAPLGRAILAISSECFSSLSLEERKILYRYQIMRLRFPLHLAIDTGLSVLLLLHTWAIDLVFLPTNIVRRRLFGIDSKNTLQQSLKLLSVPFLNFCRNIVLGAAKHSYLKPSPLDTFGSDGESITSVALQVQQSQGGLEYDFLSCNGFLGVENDIYSVCTGEAKNG